MQSVCKEEKQKEPSQDIKYSQREGNWQQRKESAQNDFERWQRMTKSL